MQRDVPALHYRGVVLEGASATSRGGVTLDVAPGELVSVLWPIRAESSALLMLAAGFGRPASGRVVVDGKPPALLRRGGRLGVLFAGDALFPHLTVRQNITLALVASGRWGGRLSARARLARRRQVALVAGLLSLGALLERYPSTLSAAPRRRVALARAVVGEPELLLLDAPLSGLPAAAREDLLASLRSLHQWLGATTLAAVSEPADALALSDRVAVLVRHDGAPAIAQVASPAVLLDQPASAAAAAAFGPINRLPGYIVRVEDDLATVRLDCGPLLEARLASEAAVKAGAACLLVVRPERIAVAAVSPEEMGEESGGATADDEANASRAIAARLIEVLELGEHLRLRLLIGSGAEVSVLRPAAAGLGGLAPGRIASIAFQPYHAVIFPL